MRDKNSKFTPLVGDKFRTYGDENCDDGWCHLKCVACHMNGGVIGETEDGMLYHATECYPEFTKMEKLHNDAVVSIANFMGEQCPLPEVVNLMADWYITTLPTEISNKN